MKQHRGIPQGANCTDNDCECWGAPEQFLSYYGDSNMCECKNKYQAEAWIRIWGELKQGNPEFHYGNQTGQELAAVEVKRLQGLAARTTLTEAMLATVRRERDEVIESLDAAKRERDAQNHRANAVLHELDKDRGRHTETLKMLEKERATSDRLAGELVKLRDELARAQSPLPPAMAIGSETQRHRQNVQQAVQRFARNDGMTVTNHPRRVAEAVYYLLDRDRLQTAAIKNLSERLDALEPNKKQAADQCAQGFAPAAPKQSFDSPPPGQW